MRPLLFAILLPALIATTAAVTTTATQKPLDQQCWESMGLTANPPPGQQSALVEQCVTNLRRQQAAQQTAAQAALRTQEILRRIRMQSIQIQTLQNRVRPLVEPPQSVPQTLPSTAQKQTALDRVRQTAARRRQWDNLSDATRKAITANNRNAAYECVYQDLTMSFDDCIAQYLAPPSAPVTGSSSLLPAEYRGQEQVTLTVGKTITTPDGVTLSLTAIASDNRCPQGTQCFSQGEARISARVFAPVIAGRSADLGLSVPRYLTIPGTGPDTFAASSSANTVAVGKCSVVFVSLMPYPDSTYIQQWEYKATFVVINPTGGMCGG